MSQSGQHTFMNEVGFTPPSKLHLLRRLFLALKNRNQQNEQAIAALKLSLDSLQKRCHSLEEENHSLNGQQFKLKCFLNKVKDSEAKTALEHREALEKLYEKVRSQEEIERENSALKQKLVESKLQAEQLEKVIAFLRERPEDDTLSPKITKLHFQENSPISPELLAQLEEEKREKEAALEEVKVLQMQFEVLKNRVLSTQQNMQIKESALKETHESIIAISEEKNKLEALLELQQNKEREVNVEAVRHELEHSHQQACAGFLEEIQSLREQIIEAGTKENELKSKLNRMTQLEEEVQFLLGDKRKVEQELYSAKTTQEDQEVRIKMAHQHLGKKVKETAILNEKNDEQCKQIVELQNALEHTKARNEELNYSLEQQIHHEKRSQEQLQEVMKSAETQVLKWEEKYFHLCDKWQESEARNRELKIVEEKYHQLHSILLNMNAVMGTLHPSLEVFQPFQLKSSAMFSPLPQNSPHSPADQPVETAKAHQDLFDYPKSFKP